MHGLALAPFVFAIGPGHNIPLLGGTPVVGKEIVMLGAVVGISSVVVVEGHAWAMRRAARPAHMERTNGAATTSVESSARSR